MTAVAFLCAGCQLPTSGPSRKEVEQSTSRTGAQAVIQVVDVDDAVTRKLLESRRNKLFSEVLKEAPASARRLGPGDVIEVTIWEAAPATLFGAAPADARGLPSTSHGVSLPEQMVSTEGNIYVPFAGRIQATGRTLPEIEADIATRLRGKANQAEILVRLTRNMSANATVIGEVTTSMRVPLTPANERLLDALAAAAGVRQPVNKMTIQITRGGAVHAMPLQAIISDPRQNVMLQPGDVVTAMFQPLAFTALGATGKNEEVPFEAQGITLAQALARAGGLVDTRSDAQAVFIFRFEPRAALDWPRQPAAVTPEGTVPVIYRFDLRDPASFFVMQSFAMSDKDLVYVSNAPAAETQKFLNLLLSAAYPVFTILQLTK